MTELLTALALAMAIEGAICALAPGWLRRAAERMIEAPDDVLRWSGAAWLALGVALLWIIRA